MTGRKAHCVHATTTSTRRRRKEEEQERAYYYCLPLLYMQWNDPTMPAIVWWE